jgi:hypothetical protein
MFSNPAFDGPLIPLLSFDMAGIAFPYIRTSGFPAFIAYLFESAESPNESFRAAAYECLSYCMGLFADDELPLDKDRLLAICDAVCTDQSLPVICAGLRLLYAVFTRSYLIDPLVTFPPRIVSFYTQFLTVPDPEPFLSTFLLDLYIFLFSQHRFYEGCLDDLIRLLLSVISTPGFAERSRVCALDGIGILAQNYSDRFDPYTADICIIYINAMSEIVMETMVEFEDETSFSAAVGVAFGHLVQTLNSGDFAVNTLALMQQLPKDSRWEMSYAALKALRRLMPTCCELISGCMNEIIDCLLGHCRHPHYFVRHEAYLVIARYLQSPEFTLQYYPVVLGAIMELLGHEELPIVRMAALIAVAVICGTLPGDAPEDLVEMITGSLLAALADSDPGSQSQIVRILSALWFSSPRAMLQSLPAFLAVIRQIHGLPINEANAGLFGRAIEAVELISELLPFEILSEHLAFFFEVWMQWNWQDLYDEIIRHLIAALCVLIAKFPDLVRPYVEPLLDKVSVLVSFEPQCVQYERCSPDIPFRHDILMFTVKDNNTYAEYSFADIQRVQLSLQLLDRVIVLAGSQCLPRSSFFEKRLSCFVRWNFCARVQIRAVDCLEDLAKLVMETSDHSLVHRLFVDVQEALKSLTDELSPVGKRRFLEFLRSLLGIEVAIGAFGPDALPEFFDSVRALIEAFWEVGPEFPAYEQISSCLIEEQLAGLIMDCYDRFPEPTAGLVPAMPTGPCELNAYFMLVCAKHVNVTHEMNPAFENQLLQAITNGFGNEDPEFARISCAAMSLLVGSCHFDPEFVSEILCCIRVTLSKHEGRQQTRDAALILFAKLSQCFPEICAKPVDVELWFLYMPVTTAWSGCEIAYQYLVFVLEHPELMEMTEVSFVKVLNIIAGVAGTQLACESTVAELIEFLRSRLSHPGVAELIDSLDEGVRAKLVSLLSL